MFDMPKYCKKNKKSVPVDKELYNRVKAQVKRKKTLKWPSFYASNHLSKLYRKKGGKYRCAFGNAVNLQNVQFRNTNPPHHNRVTYRMDFENKWENRNLWEEEDISRQYNNQFTPETVLREAFEKFIVNTPIESNTVGIQIIYLENLTGMETKTMFIGKRAYSGSDQEQFRINDIPDVSPYDDPRSTRTYVQSFEENGNNFRNDQLEELLEQLSNYFILMITLCEVYNDDPEFRTRRSRRRRRGRPLPENIPSGYYPFTIPILLLYKNVPARFLVSLPEPLDTRAINIQQQLMQNLENPSEQAQQSLLDNWNLDTQIPTVIDDIDENTNPLVFVNDQTLLNKPVSSYVFPGVCQICLDDSREDLCRVNCSVGHIFHCECVNSWRNTRKTNTYYEHGWHDDCPVCHESIESMVQLTPKVASELPNSFGKKRKNQIKVIDLEIKYLSI